MEKELQLVFKKSDDKNKTIIVTNPKDDLTAQEAQTAMNNILESGVFNSGGVALAEVVEARIKATEVTVLV